MSPDDVKKWIDILIAVIGSGSVGTIILAFIGYWRAKAERPAHIASPAPQGGLTQLAGMVLGQQQLSDLIASMSAVAAAMSEQALAVRANMGCMKEASEQRHRDMRVMHDHLDTLNDRLKDLRA